MAIELTHIPETVSQPAQAPEVAGLTSSPSETVQAQIVSYIEACYNESKESRKEVETWWDEGWSLYNNEWDFGAKEAWQSKMCDPLFGNLVDDAAEGLKRATVSALKFFRLEAANPMNQDDVRLAAFFSELVRELLKRANIFRALGGAYKNAWVTNMGVIRVTADTSSRILTRFSDAGMGELELLRTSVRNNGLRVKDIDPYFYFPDPAGRKLFEVYEFFMDKYQLLDLASHTKGFFNQDRIEELEGTNESQDALGSAKMTRLQQVSASANPYRKPIKIREFWGTLLDDRGHVLLKNALAYVADGKHLIYVDTNPLLDTESPFVAFNLVHQTDAVWGRSFSQAGSSIARERGHQANLTADGMRYATLKAFGVDVGLLEDIDVLTRGLWPGAVIPVRGGEQAIKQLNFTGPGGEVLSFLMLLQDWLGNSMNANEFVTGRPSSRGRQTKGEVSLKSEKQSQLLESIGMDLEQSFLQPLLAKSFYRLIEEFDFKLEPGLQGLLQKYQINPELLMSLTLTQRSELLGDRYRFVVSGLASQISRMFIVENIVNFLKVVGNMGELQQKFAPKIETLVNRMIDLLGLEPETLMASPEMIALSKQPSAPEGGNGNKPAAPPQPSLAPPAPGGAGQSGG